MIQHFFRNRTGNMALLAAGVLAGVCVLIAGGVDFMSITNQKQSLQGLADRAALAAAQELIVFAGSDARVTSVAEAMVRTDPQHETIGTTATIVENGKAVTVELVAEPRTFFIGPMANVEQIAASATAEVSGGGYVCMIGPDPSAVSTLNMMNRARLTANGCAIYSNSTSDRSLTVKDTARVNADLVCVAGGISGPDDSFLGSLPTEDCPPLDDPLINRPEPDVGDVTDCDYTNKIVRPARIEILYPGVYCGGLTVMGGKAILQPGIYTMSKGQLHVLGYGQLEGKDVGFFLTGAASTILFERFSRISLTAPRKGDMSGLLFEDRETTFSTYHRITSNDARKLVGTMYLPRSKLLIDATNPVADRSDYTVIIAREFELRDGPELVLNTNYEASTVPVPEGVGNRTATTINLAH